MPSKKNKWPVLFFQLLRSEDCIDGLLGRLRHEFHMAAPLDRTCLALNRRQPRDQILQRAEQMCLETEWEGDLLWLNEVFHPELATAPDPEDEPLQEDLTDFEREIYTAWDAVFDKIVRERYAAPIRYQFVNWLTDYAIEGDFLQPKPMPLLFDDEPFTVPFFEDQILVALISRLSDFEAVVEKLRARHRELFIPRTRHRHPDNIERGVWTLTEYNRIRDDPDRPKDRTIYRELVLSFQASQWGHQLSKYDLDTFDGHQHANQFLRTIVSRARKHAASLLPPDDSPPPCDG
jgi:hypothetical protein